MEMVNAWLCEMALLVSGFTYVHTIEKRERSKKKFIIDTIEFVIFTVILIAVPWVPWFGEGWAENLIPMAVFLFLIRFLYSNRKLSAGAAFYYSIWSFVSWRLMYEIWFFIKMAASGFWIQNPVFSWIGEIGIYVIGYFIMAVTIAKWMPDRGQKKIGPKQLAAAVLTFLVFENLVILSQKMEVISGGWAAIYMTKLLLAVILYLQNELFKKSDMRQELEVMNLLWKKEQEQYQLSRENIALINQKCHDLKHQIQALRNLNQEDMGAYLDEIEDSVHIYEAMVKTGNEVLDTILTEKSLYCKEQGIMVSCVADGSQLEFINTIDLYAILGNAIDNAIEAVEKLEENEKRQIDVLIYRQQKFVIINIINPMEDSLVYEEELPVTTKGNRNYHGYGLKSIKYLLDKYDGCLSIAEEDGCFSLTMLLPISQPT